MNKGRLFVVNELTIRTTLSTNIVSVATPQPTGKQWLKTIADIMADMLQVEIGDYIFLWETGTKTHKSRIHGVFRAISAPYYELDSPTDVYPFKIKIEKAFDFQNPLDEYDILNCPYIKTPLWTISGKKVAGKSRGTSPLSPMETQQLITLLIGRNATYQFFPFDRARVCSMTKPLKIDYGKIGNNPLNIRTLSDIDPNELCYLNSNYSIKYEKILETIFNQEMSARNALFFSQIGVNVKNVTWYCNYLPYSIEQSEMDYLIMESDDGIHPNRYFLIEFIKDEIDKAHIHRSLLYSKWINDTLALGQNIVQPIIICSKSVDFINGEHTTPRKKKLANLNAYIQDCEQTYSTKKLQIFIYKFSNNPPKFIQKR